MARLLFDHFWEECLQGPEVSECVDVEGSGVKVKYWLFYGGD